MKLSDTTEFEIAVIQQLKRRLDSNMWDEEFILNSHIWTFLDEAEKEKSKKPSGKERQYNPDLELNKKVWLKIKEEFGISKRMFSKKVKALTGDDYKRSAILRDVTHAYLLSHSRFYKEAVIVSGGVIEELLRLYLNQEGIKPPTKNFSGFIKACEDNGLLMKGIQGLTHFVREFRNLVHIEREKSSREAVSKSTAKSALSSIFSVVSHIE